MPDHVLRERIGDRLVVASVSGGKDSAALSLWLHEQGIEHERVFLDTGWEHPATYEYLRGELTRVVGPIREVRAPLGMADLCRKKGMFPSRTRRFCTQELKVRPMIAFLRTLEHDHVNCVGIRAEESEARAKLTEWEWAEGFDCETWRPLLRWTEQDVIDIHRRHGLSPNPLYLRGASRVGCFPCIFSRKSEIRWMADLYPERIDEISALEAQVGAAAEARQEAKGTTLAAQGYNRPCFFQASGALRSEGQDGRCVPIDEVVEWSRTSRGGRQFELFAADDRDAGCMRWGMCDLGAAK